MILLSPVHVYLAWPCHLECIWLFHGRVLFRVKPGLSGTLPFTDDQPASGFEQQASVADHS